MGAPDRAPTHFRRRVAAAREDHVKRIFIASSSCIGTALLAIAAFAATPATLKTTELGHGPTIVFLHGLGGGRLQWMPVARKLLATNRVVLVDLPGHGDSTMPDPFSFV